jgi:uncharacterized membrane protein YhiD involved in acid resistance
VALGEYVLAVATTVLVLLSLTVLRRPQRWRVFRRLQKMSETVVIRLVPGTQPGPVVAALNQIDGVSVHSLVVRDRDGELVVQADLQATGERGLEELLAPLSEREGVESLEVS